MQFVISDLIRAARVYVDDDHDDEDAWLDDTDWLRLFNVEYAMLYPRWVRQGVVTPQFVDSALTGAETTITGVLAIAGVAKYEGGRYTPLEPLQPTFGQAPWVSDTETGPATSWTAYVEGDSVTVRLVPVPNDNTGANYGIRYVPRPAYFTSVNDTVDLPYGADERLVLGMADRAGIKSRDVSRKVMEKIQDADAALAFLVSGRGNGPRVVRLSRAPHRTDRFASPYTRDPRYWRYF